MALIAEAFDAGSNPPDGCTLKEAKSDYMDVIQKEMGKIEIRHFWIDD